MLNRGALQGLRLAATSRAGVGALRAVQARTYAVTQDIRQIGDYPDLPDLSAQRKDPFVYDDPQDRRNMNETLNENDEYLSMWMPDEIAANDRLTPAEMVKELVVFLAILAGVGFLAKAAVPENPVRAKVVKGAELIPAPIAPQ